ncbi:MAG: hypothetical protein UV20_C0023G0006 [Candidatus Magasanikbacteria bacterium GW2011_GWA2_42_32]|uniref:Uncharacterized protein n=1 Tax=Candidatus Magasanikbacteria bacterium GW2011_GWA2_42_32 TaxID=1619039 RepID=A0A0G1CAE1_9BACT|nr:MAG: hypothetical protein UV20_C0023G0006 [Candidatus Magasanikbacteria bacterium GW2011_GWA2_42_32]
MHPLKLFRTGFVLDQIAKLENNESVDLYSNGSYSGYSESDVLLNSNILVADDVSLLMPDENGNHDLENAVNIYEAYKAFSPTEATSSRIWTYLAHVPHWAYMKKRWPIENQPAEKRGAYIVEHWFVSGSGVSSFARHGLAMLWWGAHVTHDPERTDPFELTREFFSMLDYTRTILTGTQGRNRIFTHALLEFVVENPELFKSQKEAKVRFLMRKSNFLGGYKILPALSKAELKNIFNEQEQQLKDEDFFRQDS